MDTIKVVDFFIRNRENRDLPNYVYVEGAFVVDNEDGFPTLNHSPLFEPYIMLQQKGKDEVTILEKPVIRERFFVKHKDNPNSNFCAFVFLASSCVTKKIEEKKKRGKKKAG